MTSIDYIYSRMNIRGVSPAGEFTGGGSEFMIQDVFAAAAMGDLSLRPYHFGLAVVTLDPFSTQESRRFGFTHIRALGERENWSFQKPYQRMINDLVKNGTLSHEDAELTKKSLGDRLPGHLFNIVLAEFQNSTRCSPCRGTGRVSVSIAMENAPTRPCKKCTGSGVSSMTDAEKARRAYIHPSTWDMTWKKRYEVVRGDLTIWLHDFQDHMTKYLK